MANERRPIHYKQVHRGHAPGDFIDGLTGDEEEGRIGDIHSNGDHVHRRMIGAGAGEVKFHARDGSLQC